MNIKHLALSSMAIVALAACGQTTEVASQGQPEASQETSASAAVSESPSSAAPSSPTASTADAAIDPALEGALDTNWSVGSRSWRGKMGIDKIEVLPAPVGHEVRIHWVHQVTDIGTLGPHARLGRTINVDFFRVSGSKGWAGGSAANRYLDNNECNGRHTEDVRVGVVERSCIRAMVSDVDSVTGVEAILPDGSGLVTWDLQGKPTLGGSKGRGDGYAIEDPIWKGTVNNAGMEWTGSIEMLSVEPTTHQAPDGTPIWYLRYRVEVEEHHGYTFDITSNTVASWSSVGIVAPTGSRVYVGGRDSLRECAPSSTKLTGPGVKGLECTAWATKEAPRIIEFRPGLKTLHTWKVTPKKDGA